MRLNMIRKSKEYGSREVHFNSQEFIPVGDDESVEELLSQGYYIFHFGDPNSPTTMSWRTKDTDNYNRGDDWSINSRIDPFVTDHNVWQERVQWWFVNATQSNEFTTELSLTSPIDEAVQQGFDADKAVTNAMLHLRNQKPLKKGKVGGRKEIVLDYALQSVSRQAREWLRCQHS